MPFTAYSTLLDRGRGEITKQYVIIHVQVLLKMKGMYCIAMALSIEWLEKKKKVEDPGIDPGTSRMLSERSTI